MATNSGITYNTVTGKMNPYNTVTGKANVVSTSTKTSSSSGGSSSGSGGSKSPSVATTTPQAIKNLQTTLNQQNASKSGYVPLIVDGIQGPKTNAALALYNSGVSTTTPSINNGGGVSPTPNTSAATSQDTYNQFLALNPNLTQAQKTSAATSFGVGNAPTPAGTWDTPAVVPPVAPVIQPEVPNNRLADIEKQLQALLGNTSNVDNAQKAIDDQNNALRTGVHNVEDQPIGMSFISGQSASLEKRNTNLQIPLQQRLANEQYKRQASIDSLKFSLDRADKAQTRQDTLSEGALNRADTQSKNASDETYRQAVLKETARNNTMDSVNTANSNKNIAGLTASQVNSTVNGIASQFDAEQIVKDYNAVTANTDMMKNIGVNGKNPGDDIAFVYAFAKIMDPNSVVREGEYATIQKYAQSFLTAKELAAVRLVKNNNFLSADAKQKLLTAANAKATVIKSQYTNLKSEYQRQIDDAYSGKQRNITDYAGNNGNVNKDPLGIR